MARRFFKIAAGASAGGLAVLVATDRDRRENLLNTVNGAKRFARTFTYGALAAYDYKYVLDPAEEKLGKTSEEYKALRKTIDKRNAERMLYVCKTHGSFYVKLGQYVSTLNYALPAEWTETLKELQDKARFRPWSDMQRVVEEDFGKPATEIFTSICETPIAAASLAQVHKAVTHDGETVAVKIQYPDLRMVAMNDLAAMYIFFHIVEVLYPSFGYTWLFPEFRQSLANEVDFLQEARNAERVAAQFSGERHVHVPSVRRDLTTDRVLTMEYIEGAKANDKVWMKENGVDPRLVAQTVVKFFAEQVHEKGMVHCDPHPGNLMVRMFRGKDGSSGSGTWQLVVLDHGMYRRLTPAFRSGYCRLWRAMLLSDNAEGEAACVDLGLRGDEYDAMSLILTNRRATSGNKLGARISRKEALETWGKYGEVTAGDVNRFLQRLPRDLLFVSRTSNLVRSLNMSLGGTTRDRYRANGEAAMKGLVLNDALLAAGLDFKVDGGSSGNSKSSATSLVRDFGSEGMEAGAGVSNVVESTSTSVLSSIAALLGRPPPPREPVTYINALAKGSVMDNPTEYELLASHKAGGKKGSKPELGLWPRLKLWVSYMQLEVRLALLDAAYVLHTWRHGDVQMYVPPHEAESSTTEEPAKGAAKGTSSAKVVATHRSDVG